MKRSLRYPLLQPAMLFGGADPLDALRGNFLLADPARSTISCTPGANTVAGVAVEAVPLYGHSPGQLGYVVADVFFCADVVLPQTVLDKYPHPLSLSLTDHLAALDRARDVSHRLAVAGHGARVAAGELAQLVDLNAAPEPTAFSTPRSSSPVIPAGAEDIHARLLTQLRRRGGRTHRPITFCSRRSTPPQPSASPGPYRT